MNDCEVWCDETLPELYDPGMFDLEETHDDVWEAVHTAIEPLLDAIEDEEDREEIEEQLTDAAHSWFKTHHEAILETLEQVDVTALCNKPQTAQHSAEWYAQRRNRLTASEFSQILDGRRGALLRAKTSNNTGDRMGVAPVGISQEDGEMNATTWGHRFEPITRRIYELEIAGLDTVNDQLGRFTHPTVSWLSASPDGLVTKGPLTGRLVEIKSPKTRQPGEFVPHEYYVQMQIQMEVCDLDAVDFIEAQFKQRPLKVLKTADIAAYEAAAWKGRIEVRGYLEDPTSWRYRYSEPVEDMDDAVFKPNPDLDLLPVMETSVWWLQKDGWHPRTVLRNHEWWAAVGWPNAQLFWAEVESIRLMQPPSSSSSSSYKQTVVVEHDGWIGSSHQKRELK